MKGLAVYWFVGCLLIGSGAALFEKRCPNDEYSTMPNYLIEIVTWPAGVAAAMINSEKAACRPRHYPTPEQTK